MPQGGGMGMLCFLGHEGNLRYELEKYIHEGTYVSRAKEQIGREIDAIFTADEEASKVSRDLGLPHRPRNLACWAQHSGGFDVALLSGSRGNYICDDGTSFKTSKKPKLSPVEQLAVYGLWFVTSEINSHGEIEYADSYTNPNGILVTDVIFHRSECIMAAYQCLHLASSIVNPHSKHDYSKYAKRGSARKETKRQKVISYVLEQYKSGGPWQSKRHAALHIWKGAVDFSKTIDYPLTETGSFTTVYNWIRKGTKNSDTQD